MDVAENRAPEWVLKSLWIVAIIVCLCMDTRATGMDGQTGILAGSTELTKGSEALRRVTIESPLPALDTSAAIILNTESPGVVSSPAKAYPQNNHR